MEAKRCGALVCTYRCALLLVAALIHAASAWAAAPIISFNLPADECPKALIEFSHQSNVEVIFRTDSLQGIRTQPVIGEFEPEAALLRMLQGTALTFEFDSDHNSVIIKGGQAVSAAQDAQPPVASVQPAAAVTPAAHDPNTLQEVVVTGTLIHGVLDAIAPVVYVTKNDLKQASFATVQDALYSLPMSSLNGPREDLGVNNNYQYGAGVNLRGLGVGATLVLVNGRRQPLAGLNGEFVDVSNIPWSAVERIEVLPDGASALYGSDAVAGVVNIIMRDDVRGAETAARFTAAPGDRAEALVSQLFGMRWDTGKASFAYQYSDATPLAAAARGYAANADKRRFGGGDYRSFYGNPGNILDPATLQPAYGIPSGQNGASLTAAALSPAINLENQFSQYQLFPERRAHSLYATASQAVGERFELFADGQFTQRHTLKGQYPQQQLVVVPRTNPYFVAPQAGSPYVIVAYSFQRDLGPTVIAAETRNYVGTVGAKLKVAENRHATLSESYGRERLLTQYGVADQAALSAALADSNPATAFNPFADGSYSSAATLAAIQRNAQQHATSGIQTTSLVADGPLVSLPAGAAKVAVGLEHRQETLEHDEPDRTDPFERTARARYGRHVSSAFAELSVPLVGSTDSVGATPRLQLTLAGRFEDYSDFGHTFNPQARLRWIPLRSLKLRASWGTSFRAPTLDDLYDSSQDVAGLAVVPDPRSASGQSLVLVRQGNNPNLTQETATTWTAGLDLAPESVAGLKVSLTYYAIDYHNRIVQPAADDPFKILVHESEWAAVITRNPTQAQTAAVCNSPDLFGSRADCLSSSPAAIVDMRLANLGATKVNGLDIEAHRSLDSRLGSLGFNLNGSYVLRFARAVTQTSPSTDILNTAGNPLALRVRVGTEWSLHRADLPGPGLSLTINHTGGYRNSASSLMPSVAPWTTVDLQLHYRTPTGDGWWSGTEFVLNGVNVLDRDPPFIDSQYGYDSMNVQPLGRVISLFARKSW